MFFDSADNALMTSYLMWIFKSDKTFHCYFRLSITIYWSL